MKQAQFDLKIDYAGCYDRHTSLSIPVSLTRSGIPRRIASHHRRAISARDGRSDRLVQLYLSFLSIYKKILIGNKITKKLLEPIVEDVSSIEDFVVEISSHIRSLMLRYVPDIRTIPQGGFKVIRSYRAFKLYSKISDMDFGRYARVKSPFLVQSIEVASYLTLTSMMIDAGATPAAYFRGLQWMMFIRSNRSRSQDI